jgi:hypothetical protein
LIVIIEHFVAIRREAEYWEIFSYLAMIED